MTPRLPQELVDKINDIALWSRTLSGAEARNLALVCRAFLPRVQSFIFRDIDVYDATSCNIWISRHKSSPRVADAVRSVTARIRNGETDDWTELNALLSTCPNLRTLALHHFEVDRINGVESWPQLLPKLRTLRLTMCHISYHLFSVLAVQLPCLDILHLIWDSFTTQENALSADTSRIRLINFTPLPGTTPGAHEPAQLGLLLGRLFQSLIHLQLMEGYPGFARELVNSSSGTLETIYIGNWLGLVSDDRFPPSVMSSLPALRSLHIGTIFVEPGVHPEADIARHLSSPKLEKFSIEYGLTEPSPRDSRWRILDEVLSPARRPSLQLVLLEIRRRDDHDRLAVVLQEYLPELQNSGRLTIKRAMNA